MKISKLVEFYWGKGHDASGRTIGEVLSFSDEQLEDVHDYIQWLFPLQEKSAFNDAAPLVTADDISIFNKNSALREKLLLSFAKLLSFYGFIVVIEKSGKLKITRSEMFAEKARNWLTPYNHNFLRITRILKSLKILGCRKYTEAFLEALEQVYKENTQIVGESVGYWRSAVRNNKGT